MSKTQDVSKTVKLAVIMDSISTINPKKDTTLGMLLAAQARKLDIIYLEQRDLFLKNGQVFGLGKHLKVFDDLNHWYELTDTEVIDFKDINIVIQRKDPPFDMNYIYTSYLLELIEKNGTLVCNKPQSLRDCNEKLFTAWFPHCCPMTLVGTHYFLFKAFLKLHKDIILKPLDGMGGSAIFRVKIDDPNINVILETLTHGQTVPIMAQQYIPEIVLGDHRIIMIDGKPISHCLARIPQDGETRANLAVGGKGVVRPLTEQQKALCDEIGPELIKRGLYFVGLDVIGDYVTEINVTSPTGIRQIQSETGIDIAGIFIDSLLSKLD